MYLGNDFPDYVKATALYGESERSVIILEPNTGETISKEVFDSAASRAMRSNHDLLMKLFKGKVTTYGKFIEQFVDLAELAPERFSDITHGIVESDDASLMITMSIRSSDRNPNHPVEFIYSIGIPVLFEEERIFEAYGTEDLIEVNEKTQVIFALTNSILMLANMSFVDATSGDSKRVIEGLIALRNEMNDVRWAGVKTELYHNVSPLIVRKRWGIVNTVDFEGGEDEDARFEECYRSITCGESVR